MGFRTISVAVMQWDCDRCDKKGTARQPPLNGNDEGYGDDRVPRANYPLGWNMLGVEGHSRMGRSYGLLCGECSERLFRWLEGADFKSEQLNERGQVVVDDFDDEDEDEEESDQ